jgi:peptidoglycan/xylan/chitin deacetylase (PgdA/CDA1 family)
LLRSILRRAQRLVPASPGLTWILSYHLVNAETGLAIDLPRETFQEHFDLLAQRTEVVALRDVVREFRGGATDRDAAVGVPGTRPRVVLTFDDAFLNFYETVMPQLAERSLPATLFVPPGFINGDGNHPLYERRFEHLGPMSWDQLAEVSAEGVEIGSHTYRHTNLVSLSDEQLVGELSRAQTEIEDRLGVRASCVCYPEGFVTQRVARIAGRFHETGVTGGGTPIGPSSKQDLMRLPRLPMLAAMGADVLEGVLHQRMALEEWVADRARRVRGRAVKRP